MLPIYPAHLITSQDLQKVQSFIAMQGDPREGKIFKKDTGLPFNLEYTGLGGHLAHGGYFLHLKDKGLIKPIGKVAHKTFSPSILITKYSIRPMTRATFSNCKEANLLKEINLTDGILEFLTLTEKTKKNGQKVFQMIIPYELRTTLAQEIECGYHFSLKEKLEIAIGLLRGLQGLHAQGIIHRNINLETCFLKKDDPAGKSIVIFADLDESKYLSEKDLAQVTNKFRSPETILNHELADKNDYKKADIYALGCILYRLFYEMEPPWQGDLFSIQYIYNKDLAFLLTEEIDREILAQKLALSKKSEKEQLQPIEMFEKAILHMVSPVSSERECAAKWVLYLNRAMIEFKNKSRLDSVARQCFYNTIPLLEASDNYPVNIDNNQKVVSSNVNEMVFKIFKYNPYEVNADIKTKTRVETSLSAHEAFQKLDNKSDIKSITPEKLTEFFYRTVKKHFVSTKIGATSYLFELIQEKNEITLHVLGDIFAHGGYGEIRRVTNCFKQVPEAFKQAIATKGLRAREAIKKEYDILSFIHSKGTRWGIQSAPRKLIKFIENVQDEKYGSLGTLYDNDYSLELQTIKYDFKSYIMDFHQLLFGLKCLEEQSILHGDIKPKNIFVKNQNDGTKLIHISDFGEAVIANSEAKIEDILSYGGDRGHTRAYSPMKDLNLSRDLKNQNNRDELIEVEEKRDVFAVGSILYRALQRARPYPYDKHGCPITDQYTNIDRIIIPQEMGKLIREMLSSDYKKRPKPKEAFQIFEQLLARKYPEEYIKIIFACKNYTKS